MILMTSVTKIKSDFLRHQSILLNLLTVVGFGYGMTYFNQPWLSFSQNEYWRSVTGLLAFNSTHFLLTFAFFILPEFRQVETVRKPQFWGRVTLLTVFWLIYFGWVARYFSPSEHFFRILLFPRVIITWHSIRQSLGLSLQETGYVKSRIFSEHNFVRVIWGLGLVFYVIALMTRNPLNGALVASCSTVTLLYAAFTVRQLGWKNGLKKVFFYPRYLFYAFYQINPIFVFASCALHGSEAVLNFLTMSKQSVGGSRAGLQGLGLLIVMTPVIAFLWHPVIVTQITGWEFSRNLMCLLFGISQAFGIVHCYIEEYLFRFKDPQVRQHVGPLMRRKAS
jgi:hypothetical protein